MKRGMILYGALVMIVITWGCATFQKGFQKPSIAFDTITMGQVSFCEATPIFHFKVNNPNPIDLTLKHLNYNLKLNGKNFLKGMSDKKLAIKKRSTGKIQIPLTVNFLDLFNTFNEFIKAENVRYDLSGYIDIGIFSLPYRAEGEITLPKIPQISLEQINLTSLSLTNARLDIMVGVQNPNPYSIGLSGLEYDIKLAGESFVNGATRNIRPVAGNGVSLVKIPININIGMSLYNLLTKSSSGYEISGKMKFDVPKYGERSVEYQKSGKVPLGRTQ